RARRPRPPVQRPSMSDPSEGAQVAEHGLERREHCVRRATSSPPRLTLLWSGFACSKKTTWLGHSAFRIEAGAAKILIDPFLSDAPSWDKGWSGCLAGKNLDTGR